MFKRNRNVPLKVVILIATCFDEVETIQCLVQMRQAGHATEIIGHKAGLITGVNGLAIRPDRTLIDLIERESLQLLILPGTTQSTMALLSDPRVHRLFTIVAASGGHLAIMNQAEEAFLRAGLLDILSDPSVISQGQSDLDPFSRNLINLVTV